MYLPSHVNACVDDGFLKSIPLHPSSNSVDIGPPCTDVEKFRTSLYHPGAWQEPGDMLTE